MTIKYSSLGMDLQLNQVVMAGSHDAGISEGPRNAKTQTMGILGQAQAGVRFFDVRVAAQNLGGTAVLKTYHAQKADKKERMVFSADAGREIKMVINTLPNAILGETFGVSLTRILNDARSFVESADGQDEFLILKFDKCHNWDLIAEAAQKLVGNRLLTQAGNVNEMTLRDVRGKVIAAFMPQGYAQLKWQSQKNGITPIKNLYKPPSGYESNFNGIQYWGEGGTNPFHVWQNHNAKTRANISKQEKIMAKAATGMSEKQGGFLRKKKVVQLNATADPNAMGMMYWTSTGMLESIRSRNDTMWGNNTVNGLDTIWRNGFEAYVQTALPTNVNARVYSSGGNLKMFMPNIVMIDFADAQKCEHIFNVNTLAANKLVDICDKLGIN